MTAITKLLFDLCFYYTLSGYFVFLVTENSPSIWGIPIIIAVNIAFYLIRRGISGGGEQESDSRLRVLKLVFMALPALFFMLSPSLWQIIQFLPAWLYSCVILWSGRYVVSYMEFENHFSFTGKFYFLMFIGIAFLHRIPEALSGSIPYFSLYILSGIFLMRVLRAEGKLSALNNAAVLIALLAAAVAITVFRAPQLVSAVLSFLYNNVVIWVLTGLAMVVAGIGYGFYYLFAFLVSIFGREPVEPDLEFGEMAQEILGAEIVENQGLPLVWLKVALLTLLAIAIIITLILICRRLLGSKAAAKTESAYKVEQERLERKASSKAGGRFRPKDPRLAVRWYYRKYLKEGVSRGGYLTPPDTSRSVQKKFAHYFTAETSGELREVYIKSRYSQKSSIENSDANEAQELWKTLKGDK